jgi:hypothetical protein
VGKRFPSWAYAVGGATLLAVAAGGAFLLGKNAAQQGSEGPAASVGLPDTAD